jgi:hypothetical protein
MLKKFPGLVRMEARVGLSGLLTCRRKENYWSNSIIFALRYRTFLAVSLIWWFLNDRSPGRPSWKCPSYERTCDSRTKILHSGDSRDTRRNHSVNRTTSNSVRVVYSLFPLTQKKGKETERHSAPPTQGWPNKRAFRWEIRTHLNHIQSESSIFWRLGEQQDIGVYCYLFDL